MIEVAPGRLTYIDLGGLQNFRAPTKRSTWATASAFRASLLAAGLHFCAFEGSAAGVSRGRNFECAL
jgi:hypothetical protein